ncbi:MAG: hypothetical protein NTZ38_00395, partial [Candidatus Taylorbacteria bacterium]|nr:hypothetical protein [Candidatus Taylorbacteria bacterium]
TLSSSSGFIQGIANALFDLIKSVGNLAVNTVTAVTGVFTNVQSDSVQSNSIDTRSIHTDTLCADDVCINKDQLKALLIQAGGISSSTQSTTAMTSVRTLVTSSGIIPVSIEAATTSSITTNISDATSTPIIDLVAPIDSLAIPKDASTTMPLNPPDADPVVPPVISPTVTASSSSETPAIDSSPVPTIPINPDSTVPSSSPTL